MQLNTDTARFESAVMVHLDSAWNLARWMVRSEHDAQDVVQEACLRALRAFDAFRGGDGRCWLLTIVRNTCCTWLERNRRGAPAPFSDDDLETLESVDSSPADVLIRQLDSEKVRLAIEKLPPEFREIVILRELEDLSYKEISTIAQIPVGTVMSRLARARKRLQEILSPEILKEA